MKKEEEGEEEDKEKREREERKKKRKEQNNNSNRSENMKSSSYRCSYKSWVKSLKNKDYLALGFSATLFCCLCSEKHYKRDIDFQGSIRSPWFKLFHLVLGNKLWLFKLDIYEIRLLGLYWLSKS